MFESATPGRNDVVAGRKLAERTEWLLWITAILCLGSVAYAGVSGWAASQQAARIAQNDRATAKGAHGVTSEGDVIGKIEIRQIGLSVPITAGIETKSLVRGVGHIDGTAWPGGLGTVGLAGHRDTYFRPLRRIANGMDVRLTDHSGVYHYSVDSTEIVLPEQVEVLAIRDRPELTLVTCYPFDFVGQAPKRFIVHAHLISVVPDAEQRTP